MINLENSNSTEINLVVKPSGKAPEKYGNDVIRFEEFELSVLLAKRNWNVIKKTKKYIYAIPPKGIIEPFQIRIRIPKKDYILKLSETYYQSGESVNDQLGEWPLVYIHNRNRDIIEYGYDYESKNNFKIIHENTPESFFMVGGDLWSLEVSIIDGKYEINENARNTISDQKDIFMEGSTHELTLTKYERNTDARQKCIDHYGYRCQICGFDFSKKYGTIGRNIIQVHHKIPLSKIRSNYSVDPINDLIPVCPNCHVVIHSKDPIYEIAYIQQLIEECK